MPQEFTLPELVADLVALRHVGGYRFRVPERVLRQFAEHCRREGYPDGSITQEALDGFLYGRHLRSSTVRRNELALRQLAEHAHTHHGWAAHIPAARTRVRASHQPPYVLTKVNSKLRETEERRKEFRGSGGSVIPFTEMQD